MASNYDNSASFYDGLSRVVFGRTLVDAQKYFLPQIPAGCKILIIGGGTGWILEEIGKVHASGLHITYVEISARMMTLSRKRNTGANKVEFINKAVEGVEFAGRFDVIITPFLFDNYRQEDLPATFKHIQHLLQPGGLWLNTDFQLTGKWWQFVLLKSMLLFFKVLCGVESWRLPDVGKEFDRLGYSLIQTKSFYKDFVVTKLYKK